MTDQDAIHRAKSFYERMSTRSAPVPGERIEAAVTAHRGFVLAEAIIVFVIGFSLDDLHVLRFPGYLLALGGAFVVLVFAGMAHGARMARQTRHLDDARFRMHLAARRRSGALAAVLMTVVATAWFVFFSSGVPPWAA